MHTSADIQYYTFQLIYNITHFSWNITHFGWYIILHTSAEILHTLTEILHTLTEMKNMIYRQFVFLQSICILQFYQKYKKFFAFLVIIRNYFLFSDKCRARWDGQASIRNFLFRIIMKLKYIIYFAVFRKIPRHSKSAISNARKHFFKGNKEIFDFQAMQVASWNISFF